MSARTFRFPVFARLNRLAGVVIALQLGWTARAQYWQPDPSFAPVLESLTTGTSQLFLLPAAGGKLIVTADQANTVINGVQSASGLFRLNADGTVDRSFAPSDSVALRALLAYPDGGVLVEQTIDSVGVGVSRLSRLAVNGATDSAFHPVDVNVGAYGLQAQLLADRRILLSGLFTSVGGVAQSRMCVLNTDGTVSDTFRSPFRETAFSSDWDYFSATVLPDGRYLVAGSFAYLGSAQLQGAARLLADGTIDETFNANAVPYPQYTAPEHLYPLHDGRMLVSYGTVPSLGSAYLPRGIFRLNSSGAFDPSFQAAAVGTKPYFGPQQSDDKIIYIAYDSNALRRLNPDGTNDSAFQTGSPSGGQLPVLDASGTTYIGSPMTAARDASHCWITHLLADGSIDPNYSPGIRQQAQILAFARQPDGKVLVTGALDYVNGERVGDEFSLVRLLSDGSLDHSFNATLGRVGGWGETQGLIVQPTGTVVAIGDPNSGALPIFVRFGVTGALDPSFHLASGPRADIEADSNGRIYGVTSDTSGLRLRRYSADGDLDSSYAPDALTAPAVFGVWPDGSAVATVQTGIFPEQRVRTLARFRSDGSYDPAFQVDASSLPNLLFAVVSLPGGGVVAIGAHQDPNSALTFIRFSPTGTVEYRYEGGVDLIASDQLRAREVGGVLYDALQAGSAPAGSRVKADFNMQFHTSVEVDASGTLTALDRRYGQQTLSVLRRTSLAGPSVDPKPTVLASTNADPGDLSVGGRTTLTVQGTGLYPLTYQWTKDGVAIAGATSASYVIDSAQPSDGGNYSVVISNAYGSISSAPIAVSVSAVSAAPTFSSVYDPPNRLFLPGVASTLTALGFGNPLPVLTWFHNGELVVNPPATITRKRDRVFSSQQIGGTPADTGLYTVVATSPSGSLASGTGIVGLLSATKVTGAGAEVGADILHPNGNTYDQILLQGSAASITADPGQVARTSFVDLNGDIVQVEFAGAGTLSLVLAAESGPAVAENYNQPTVSYVKGHAGIVIVNADETTNVTVFSVGRATAYDPTGRFNIIQPISPTNDPANNGNPLFEGHGSTAYDAVADLAYIAILSRNGKFGGIRAGNASFFASKGFTGIYAPNVLFQGPVYAGNIDGHADAAAGLILGAAVDTRIVGGNLAQANGRSVQVRGITQLKFMPGTTSDNKLLPAQANQATLVQNGVDVTAQIAAPPSP